MTKRALAASLSLALVSNVPCQALANTIAAPTQAGSGIVVVPGRSLFTPLSPEQRFGLGQGFVDMQSVGVLPSASPIKVQPQFQGSAAAAPVSQALKASPVAAANVPMPRPDQLKPSLAPAQARLAGSGQMLSAQGLAHAETAAQQQPQEQAESEGTAVKLGAAFDGSKLQGLGAGAADPVPAKEGAFRSLLGRAKGSASAAKQDIARFLGQGKQLLIRFKETTVIDLGGMLIEATVTEENILEELERVGMRVLSVAPGRVYRVLFDSRKGDAAVWTAQMEAHPYVLYAAPFGASAPVWNQLTLTFRESVIVRGDISFESSVREDDMAEILRKHGLTVLESLSDRSFRVAVPYTTDAEKVMTELSQEAMVARVSMRRGAALLHKVYKAVDWFADKALLVLLAVILAGKLMPVLTPYILLSWAIATGIALFERAIHSPYTWHGITAGALSGFVVSLAAAQFFGSAPTALALGTGAGVLAVLTWRFLRALARERRY